MCTNDQLQADNVKMQGEKMPRLFTADDYLDIGIDLGSRVSLDYDKKVPFAFGIKFENVHVRNIK